MGRLHDVGQGFKAFLSATATGILIFLFWDVLTDAIKPVEDALHASSWGRFSWLAALAFAGFAIGLLTLVYYDSWMKARRRKSFLGPGAASAGELERSHFVGLTPARWLALLIATGIGLHNFSEGLAIGQAGARGAISLAVVLIVGFGLHNATEGFGIVAPLAGRDRPSWRFLGLLGLIGGGPTARARATSQTRTTVAPAATGRWSPFETRSRSSGRTSAITPAFRAAKCAIVPMTFPSATSPRPRRAGTATRATSSTSTDAATAVFPSNVSETPSWTTVRLSPSPSSSPPPARATSPATRRIA